MEARPIGSLSVPVVGLGCNQLGAAGCDEATSIAIVHEAIDAGVTFFDIADEYGQDYTDRSAAGGWGRSEEILGKALRGRRDEVLIATKFGARPQGAATGGGNGPDWIRVAVDDSLRRLGTDHVDLYQIHFPDPDVPIAETLGALDEIVQAGKAREVGCCNFTSAMLHDADAATSASGGRRLVSLQSRLNLFQRGAVTELLPTCVELGLSFIPYFPLASGMLTGKYRRGAALPADARLSSGLVSDEARQKLFSEKAFARLEALEAFAAERGHTLIELAFAWLLAQPTVATVIAGASRTGQASANAAAASSRLSPDEAAAATDAVARAA